MRHKGLLLSAAIASGSVAHGVSNAQTDTTAAALEEIIVTAERREVSLQDTAIAITAYDGEQLAELGVNDMQALSAVAPSVIFAQVGGEAYVSIRGISSRDLTEIGDPAVLISADGFSTSRPYGVFATLYDIERVEVLKGPQGTLYGRNAAGGAINIITRRPGRDFDGKVSFEVGDYETYNVEAAVDLPISDAVQLRIAGLKRTHEGYRDNGPQLDKGDDEDATSGRLHIALQPTEDFRALVTFQHSRQDGVGQSEAHVPFVSSGGFVSHALPTLGDSKEFLLAAPYFVELRNSQARWEFVWDGLPAGISATYLGGYDKTDWHHGVDRTPAGVTPARQFLQNEFPRTWNHELRLASAAGDRLNWQAGAYKFEEDSNLFSHTRQVDGVERLYFDHPVLESSSEAVFGQISYALNDQFTLSLGGRNTWDDKERDGRFVILVPVNVVIPQSGRADSSQFTYHIGLDYGPSVDHLIYAKVDKGYKQGGFTTFAPYDPETVVAYEIGSKSEFLARRLRLNTSVFYQDYRDKQVSQFVAAGSGTLVQNADETEIYGADVQFNALVTDLTRIDFEVNYLHSEFTDFIAAPGVPLNPALYPNCTGAPGQQNCQLSGYPAPLAPEWRVALGLEQRVAHVWGGEIAASVQASYSSDFNFDFFDFESTRQESYTLLNANLTYTRTNEASAWYAGLYGRNLTDEVVFSGAGEVPSLQQYVYSYLPPRTYGVRVGFNF